MSRLIPPHTSASVTRGSFHFLCGAGERLSVAVQVTVSALPPRAALQDVGSLSVSVAGEAFGRTRTV